MTTLRPSEEGRVRPCRVADKEKRHRETGRSPLRDQLSRLHGQKYRVVLGKVSTGISQAEAGAEHGLL